MLSKCKVINCFPYNHEGVYCKRFNYIQKYTLQKRKYVIRNSSVEEDVQELTQSNEKTGLTSQVESLEQQTSLSIQGDEQSTYYQQQQQQQPNIQQRSQYRSQPTQQYYEEYEEGSSWTTYAVFGFAGLVVMGGVAYFLKNKRDDGGTLEEAADAVASTANRMVLQREATQRLNSFADILRSTPNANLSGKNLGNEGCAYVCESLAFNGVCQSLDLSQNGIGEIGVKALCQALKNNDAIQNLNLSTNNLQDEGAQAIAETIANHPSIQSLNLSGNSIGDTGAAALAEALRYNKALKNLNLGMNNIDTDGTKAIAQVLCSEIPDNMQETPQSNQSTNTTLESLNLSDNYVGPLGAGTLARALKYNIGIVKLNVGGNSIGEEGSLELCRALLERDNIKMQELNMSKNDVVGEAIDAVAEIVQNHELRELNLYMNNFGDDAMIKIATALKDNKSIETLVFGYNNVSWRGVQVLADNLSGNSTLKNLDLSYNPLDYNGIQDLVNVLKYSTPGLEILNLRWCKAGQYEGAQALADLIMYNSQIKNLDISGNGLKDNGTLIISRSLREHENNKLLELDMAHNEIKDEGAFAVAQALKANPENAPKELKLFANYLSEIAYVALNEAVEMVYDMSGREIIIMMQIRADIEQ